MGFTWIFLKWVGHMLEERIKRAQLRLCPLHNPPIFSHDHSHHFLKHGHVCHTRTHSSFHLIGRLCWINSRLDWDGGQSEQVLFPVGFFSTKPRTGWRGCLQIQMTHFVMKLLLHTHPTFLSWCFGLCQTETFIRRSFFSSCSSSCHDRDVSDRARNQSYVWLSVVKGLLVIP